MIILAILVYLSCVVMYNTGIDLQYIDTIVILIYCCSLIPNKRDHICCTSKTSNDQLSSSAILYSCVNVNVKMIGDKW